MTLVEAQTRSLDDVSQTIVREHALVVQSARATVDHAIAAGEALNEARALIPRGEWEQYMASVVGRIDVARVYMRLARYQHEIRNTDIVNIDEAVRYLATPRASALAPALKDDAQRLSAKGLTTRQIARQLDVAPATAWRLLNPAKDRHARRRKKAELARARAALERQTNERLARQAGGSLAKGYALLRRALQTLETAHDEADEAHVRAHIGAAVESLHHAEDDVGHALRGR